MERETTQLIARDRLSGEEVRRTAFPTVLRGLDRQSVEDFQRRVGNELDDLHAQLADQAEELMQLRGENAGLHTGLPDAGPPAVDVLALATKQADQIIEDAQAEAHRIVAGARQQHEAITAEARQQHEAITSEAGQQARQLVTRATEQAERDAARIRNEAPAEARRIVAHYEQLAAAMREGLLQALNDVGGQLADWTGKAQDGPVAEGTAPPRQRRPRSPGSR